MFPNDDDFSITPEQIDQAKREKARLDEIIARANRRAAALDQFLASAALLNSEAENADETEKTAEDADMRNPEDIQNNMMGIIAQIANGLEQPITKSALKAALKERGLSPERVDGSYFYVAIDRLKKRGRISVLKDGEIWRS